MSPRCMTAAPSPRSRRSNSPDSARRARAANWPRAAGARGGGRGAVSPASVAGGLESKGHPIAATGLAQVHELVLQLRGTAGKRTVEKARFGMAVNGGGFIGVEEAVSCITILERV